MGAGDRAWADDVIWWHLHPLTFLGAPPHGLPDGAEPEHRLRRLEPWLDHLVSLGCNGLALGPLFASQTHGYDTVDHLRVDPRLGDEQDLTDLVEQCHRRGIRLQLDGVFNHVGRGFAAFADVLAHRGDSPFASWFRLDPADAGAPDGFGYADFEGHRGLVALNHDEPAVVAHVVDVLRYWLDRGVDGWRLDAAYAVPIPFWRTVTDQVRATHPAAWFLGEVIHGDYPRWVTGGGLDTVTQYELWKAVWSGINDGNLFELAHALDRHAAFASSFVPFTFVGNHDVTRIASRLDDVRHLGHAVAVLFTVPGTPAVYAGDEHAFRGVKHEREGGDDEIRPAFPASPDDLAPDGLPVLRLHQELIGLRRRHPWLVHGTLTAQHVAGGVLVYRCTEPGGDGTLLVVLNLGDEPYVPDLDDRPWHVLAGDRDDVAVPGHAWAVLTPSP